MMDLQENLQQVEANICKACENAGRKRSDVTLIAVSKTKPIEMLQTVYDLGARDFGENKVQEMCEKMEVLPKNIRWHMIGHLQTNKVKYIVGKTELIHSVDSLHLAKEIEKQAAKQNVTVSILVEVNIAEEESKFGIHKEETLSLIRQIAALPHIQILGRYGRDSGGHIFPFHRTITDDHHFIKHFIIFLKCDLHLTGSLHLLRLIAHIREYQNGILLNI